MGDSFSRQADVFLYHGGSMWPCFQEGDLLLLKSVAPGNLQRGDCIVYQRGDSDVVCVHRIVGMQPLIRSRGDARLVEDDEPVDPSWIIGRVEQRVRFGRSSRVANGRLGVWAGCFYRYAGKIDPGNTGKGGRLARSLQRLLTPLTTSVIRRCSRTARFSETDGSTTEYLLLGRSVLAQHNDCSQRWSIAWPMCIWVGHVDR